MRNDILERVIKNDRTIVLQFFTKLVTEQNLGTFTHQCRAAP